MLHYNHECSNSSHTVWFTTFHIIWCIAMFLETQVRQLQRRLEQEKKANKELQDELESTKDMLAQWVHIYVASYFYSLSSLQKNWESLQVTCARYQVKFYPRSNDRVETLERVNQQLKFYTGQVHLVLQDLFIEGRVLGHGTKSSTPHYVLSIICILENVELCASLHIFDAFCEQLGCPRLSSLSVTPIH